jgi:hypothetical protein
MEHAHLTVTKLNRKLHTILDGAKALKEKLLALDLCVVETAGLVSVETAVGTSSVAGDGKLSNGSNTAYDRLETHRDRLGCSSRNGILHMPAPTTSKASKECENEQTKHSKIRKWANELPLHDVLVDCIVALPLIQTTDQGAQEDPLDSLANLSEHRITAIAAAFESRLQRLITARLAELRTSRSSIPGVVTAGFSPPDPPLAAAVNEAAATHTATHEAKPRAETAAAAGSAKRAAHLALF